jgi:hypothetical protein
VEETSILLLALAHAAWQRQAFAHRRLRARPLIPFHITLDQNIKRDPFKSEALESKTYSVHVKPGGALQIPLSGTSKPVRATLCACDLDNGDTKWKMSVWNWIERRPHIRGSACFGNSLAS